MKKAFLLIAAVAILLAPLAAAEIHVTAPAAGGKWFIGGTHTITWNSAGVAGPLAIKLFAAGAPRTPVLAISDNADNSGTFSWTIPGTLPAGRYQVRVRTVSAAPLVFGDSGEFEVGPTFVNHMPGGQLPPMLKFPRLEVSGIDLAPNTEGFGIVFNYKNVGNGALPKASEAPLKPSYRVLIDGKETASGSLFIPAFAAPPGWEQKGYFGGWIVLPSVRTAMDTNWHIGNTITVHINENKVMGMESHTLALNLKTIAMKYKYDLVRTGITLDWNTRELSVSLQLNGNVPVGRELLAWCGWVMGSDSYFMFRQPASPGFHVVKKKVDFPSYKNQVTLYLVTVVSSPDVNQQAGDMDNRNDQPIELKFVRPDPNPVM